MSRLISGSECLLKPKIEMYFATLERAQKAEALLYDFWRKNSKVFISEMLFDDGGRMLILKFSSFGAHPSDIVSYVFAVVIALQSVYPVWKHVSIPLVPNST